MTKQPVISGFSQIVFATAKHRAQAAIQHARRSLIKDSLCGYAQIFEEVLPGSFLAKIDPTKRQRSFALLPPTAGSVHIGDVDLAARVGGVFDLGK